jgi:23S rRNA pseudouridine2457 synthase
MYDAERASTSEGISELSPQDQSFRLILFNKPLGVLTRFTDHEQRANLADFIKVPDVYPVGRLDKDSEGLLLLTDRGSLVKPLLTPGRKKKKYVVCVEGEPTVEQLEALRSGPTLNDGETQPSLVRLLRGEPDWVWERDPPIRFRKSVPVSWLELVISEGRNRQVRRMTAAVGLPTLRLIRTEFAHFKLSPELSSGQWREATASEKTAALALEKPGKKRRRRRKRYSDS